MIVITGDVVLVIDALQSGKRSCVSGERYDYCQDTQEDITPLIPRDIRVVANGISMTAYLQERERQDRERDRLRI